MSSTIPIIKINAKTIYLYIVFSINWIWETFNGIKDKPNRVLQDENVIIFSFDILNNFFIVLFIAKIIKLKYEKLAEIQSKIKIESILFKKSPSSICLDKRNNEFIGILFEFDSKRLSIDITVDASKM